MLPSILVLTAVLTASEADTPDLHAARSTRIDQAFNDLNKDTIDELDAFYAEDVHFEDPLGTIKGLDSLKVYYANLYESVEEISFEFTEEVVQDETHVVMWIMRLKTPNLRGGKEVTLEGNSVIRFGEGDKVVYHRDYFDMGEFVYEHVPIVGFLVRQVKKRLDHEEPEE